MSKSKNNGCLPGNKTKIEYRDELVHSLLFCGSENFTKLEDELKTIFGVTIRSIKDSGQFAGRKSRGVIGYELAGNAAVLPGATEFVNEVFDAAEKFILSRNLNGIKAVRNNVIFFYTGNGPFLPLAHRHEQKFRDTLFENKLADAAAARLQLKNFHDLLVSLSSVDMKLTFGDSGRLLSESKVFADALAMPETVANSESYHQLLKTPVRAKGGHTIGSILVGLGLLGGGGACIKNADVFNMASFGNGSSCSNGNGSDPKPLNGNKTSVSTSPGGRKSGGINKLVVAEFSPKSREQVLFSWAIDDHQVTFGIGTSGGGKTFEALRKGLDAYLKGNTAKVTIIRAMTTAAGGPGMGEVPGDENQKMKRWFSALDETVKAVAGGTELSQLVKAGIVEIRPPDYLRGATLNGFTIIDEGQNLPDEVLEDLLFRPGDKENGESGKIVITGNIRNQIDINLRRFHPGILYALDIFGRMKIEGVTPQLIGTDDSERLDLAREALDQIAFIAFPAETGRARNKLAPGLSIIASSLLSREWHMNVANEFYSDERARHLRNLQPRIERAEAMLDELNFLVMQKYLHRARRELPELFPADIAGISDRAKDSGLQLVIN